MDATTTAVPPCYLRDGRKNWHQRRRHGLVEKLARGLSGRILDYGCGYGDLSYAMSRQGEVVGVDVDAARVEFAKSQFPELEFRLCDTSVLPFDDGSFDVVLSSVVLPFVEDHAAYIQEVRRVLVPGGHLVLLSKGPAAVKNGIQRLFFRQPTPGRLNIADRATIRDALTAASFTVEAEGYFFDPPFDGWKRPRAVMVGMVEQLCSLFRVRSIAPYFGFRARLR